MARRFSMDRGMALRSWPGRGCGLGLSQFGGRSAKLVTAGRWCQPQTGSRRGRRAPLRCAHAPWAA
jgi:hypothetical protein